MMMYLFGFLFVFLAHLVSSNLPRLNDIFSNYEILNYSTNAVNHAHLRVRRSVSSNNFPTPPVRLAITAFEHNLTLILLPRLDLLSPEAEVVIGDRSFPRGSAFMDHIYRGHVDGFPNSVAYGSIINGVFSGTIIMNRDSSIPYHIEPAGRYFPNRTTFHSIAYQDNSVKLRGIRKNDVNTASVHASFCGLSNPSVFQNMSRSLRTVLLGNSELRRTDRSSGSLSKHLKYSYSSNVRIPRSSSDPRTHARSCSLYLRSDTFLWNHVMSWPHVNGDKNLARLEISSLFAKHVQAAEEIFQGTVFRERSGSVTYGGIGFRLERIQINVTDVNCKSRSSRPLGSSSAANPKLTEGSYADENPLCTYEVDAQNFLNQHSEESHDKFCLSYMFTYRDFPRGVVGLAFVGGPNNAGGICAKRSKLSYNTGFVTLANYDMPVPLATSQLVFAHELGHSFGAPHDENDEYGCVPPAELRQSHYLMFPTAAVGSHPSNREFSSCSKDAIAGALKHVLESSRNCFVASGTSFCGNGVVEEDEECDCGLDPLICQDQCCNPPDSPDKCRLKKQDGAVQCSPTAGQCCTNSCQFRASTHVCLSADDCSAVSHCSGTSAKCPNPTPVDDGTPCQGGSRVCKGGQCIGSLCDLVPGWSECSSERSSNATAEILCYTACRENRPNAPCVNTFQLKNHIGLQEKYKMLADKLLDSKVTIQLRPGMPCDNFQGYCDFRLRCRPVEDDGPLNRLGKMLFSPQTLDRARHWIIAHWWAMLLISVGAVVVAVLFVKIFSYSTPHAPPDARLPPRSYEHRRDVGRLLSPGYWTTTLRSRARHRREHLIAPVESSSPHVVLAPVPRSNRGMDPGSQVDPRHLQHATRPSRPGRSEQSRKKVSSQVTERNPQQPSRSEIQSGSHNVAPASPPFSSYVIPQSDPDAPPAYTEPPTH